MKKTVLLTICLLVLIMTVHGRKTSRSRSSSSGRGSSRKTYSNPQPAPTSFSKPQASAPKPSLFGWQEKPAQKSQSHSTWQSKPSSSQSHSYPSSQTGLSGSAPGKQPPPYQESIQRASVPQQTAQRSGPQTHTNNQPSHSYPASNGLSGSGSPGTGSANGQRANAGYPLGNSGSLSGVGYPQGKGLSGTGASYPQSNAGSGVGASYPQGSGISGSGSGYPHSNPGAATGVGYQQGSGVHGVPPPPYSGYRPGSYNAGNHPPPPYSGNGYNYGGGGHGYNPNYGAQMPGYFGNYGNYGKGFGGVSRTGSALTGIGIAGAGVGTILTGLALWNLARSTGHHHHTVIYDNRGQPVAVAPANGTEPNIDPILKDLVNCTLTISNDNATEVLAIPCAIATSFTPEADVKDESSVNGKADNTKCTVTVVTKTGKEFMTTIPCSILLNTAAENNVTEPPIIDNVNGTLTEIPSDTVQSNHPSALKLTVDGKNDTQLIDFDCKPEFENGTSRDPLNPCYSVTTNLTVLPLDPTTSSPNYNGN